MRRDRLPVVLAGVTAVVSCGVLALAVSRGWLGADVGRGANFCEAPRDLAVRQPANTFSNLGFVVAGLLIAWHAGGRSIGEGRSSGQGRSSADLASAEGRLWHRYLAPAMACIVVLLGPASAAMHATQSALGGHLDMLSMYLIASFAAAYAVTRWRRGGRRLFAIAFAGGIAFCEIVGLWSTALPVVHHSGNVAFGLLLLAATALEVRIIRRGDSHRRPGYVYGSVASMVTAFAIWNATNAGLCAPYSLIQGHAVWHLLCAVAAYLLYRYYASEAATGEAASLPRRAGAEVAG